MLAALTRARVDAIAHGPRLAQALTRLHAVLQQYPSAVIAAAFTSASVAQGAFTVQRPPHWPMMGCAGLLGEHTALADALPQLAVILHTVTAALTPTHPRGGIPSPPSSSASSSSSSSAVALLSKSSKVSPPSWGCVLPLLWSKFSSFSLFEFLYLMIEASDSHDLKRTMVLQVILIVNMFASLVPRTRLITYSHLECP